MRTRPIPVVPVPVLLRHAQIVLAVHLHRYPVVDPGERRLLDYGRRTPLLPREVAALDDDRLKRLYIMIALRGAIEALNAQRSVTSRWLQMREDAR